ncbi:unnamed protein product, partial [Prorocentrum cordatum]
MSLEWKVPLSMRLRHPPSGPDALADLGAWGAAVGRAVGMGDAAAETDVPPPETSVVLDEGKHRCELVAYVSKGGWVKDVRVRGPLRGTRREALRDCLELRKAAAQCGDDASLHEVRDRRRQLETTQWTEKDLGGRQLEGAEGRAAPRASARAPKARCLAAQGPARVQAPAGAPAAPPPEVVGRGGWTATKIQQRVAELSEAHSLDQSSHDKLASVFAERLRRGCDLEVDFDELGQHLAASNKPSALVSMKLGDLRSGRQIGPCKFTGGRKDAGSSREGGRRYMAAQVLQTPSQRAGLKPVGPGWKRAGQLCALPEGDGDWMIHERQEQGGKYRPWLFFNSSTGKYFQEKASGDGYMEVGVPHDPQEHELQVRASSSSAPSRAGRKLDMAVLLPELHKTGLVLKQPLEFLDRPAALFVLCDGLRGSGAAAEFCARRLHALLLPRLGERATEWEDFELAGILQESVEALDRLLLDAPARFAGCGLAVALLTGRRLVVGALGATRCLLCTAPEDAGARGAKATAAGWACRLLAGGPEHTAADRGECLRVASTGGPLLGAVGGGLLHPRSAPQACLEAMADEQERELLRVSRATSPFAALGLAAAELQEGPAGVRRIFRKRSLAVHPDKVAEASRARSVAAFAKLEAACSAVEAILQVDASAAALVAELFAAQDSGSPEADPAAAARLLGLGEGCGAAAAKEAARRFLEPLGLLQDVCPQLVRQALRILEGAEAAVARGVPALWTPAEE